MEKTPLSKNTEFVVGEAKVLDYIMALICFGIFLYGLIDTLFKESDDNRTINTGLVLFGLPAIIYLAKARSRRVYIRINKKGIFQDEELVTNWKNFLKAYIDQEEVAGGIKDNFILVVEHLKENSDLGFRRHIPLTNTQNKSEEEVLEAVNFFSNEYSGELA